MPIHHSPSNPHKISSNISVNKEDLITEEELQNKLDGLDQTRPLKLCYAGRAIEMKGPMDWLKTVHELIKRGVRINATWLGDGSLLSSMRTTAEALEISDYVSFSRICFGAAKDDDAKGIRFISILSYDA